MTNKKIVLFDLDGTLIDTAPDMYLALNILLSEEKMETVPYDKIRPQVSNGVLGIFSVVFSDDPVIEGDRYERYLDIYESVLGQECKLFSNANNLLDSLDLKDIDLKNFLIILINKCYYKKETIIKYLIYDFLELFIRNCSDYIYSNKYNYFLKRIHELKKYNLDDESFFIEFETKILNV